MANKLSHSGIQLYKDCGRAFDLRYNKHIVKETKSSALYFGSALDDALNDMLLYKKKGANPEPPKDLFIKRWKMQSDNSGKLIKLLNRTDVQYFKGDVSESLFDDVDIKKYKLPKSPTSVYLELYNQAKSKELTDKEKKQYNNIAWVSLKNKGLLLIDEYEKTMMPLVEETIEVQKYVSLKNKDGDVVRGYVDGIVRIDGAVVCLDNKTSSVTYGPDSVKNSEQLALYQLILNNEGYGIEKCAYFVLHKRLLAKNKVKTEIIIDTIPKENLLTILNSLSNINSKIKAGVFEPNFNSCKRPWGLCDYYNLCHANSMQGLVELKESKDNGKTKKSNSNSVRTKSAKT